MRYVITYTDAEKGVPSIFICDDNMRYIKGYSTDEHGGFRGVSVSSGKIWAASAKSIYVFDFDLNPIVKFRTGGTDNHGIFVGRFGVFSVCSETSNIVLHDNDGGLVTGFHHGDWRGKHAHINSVFVDGLDTYVTVHNFENEGYVYRIREGDDERIPVVTDLCQPHDFTLIGNGYIVNDSKRYRVVCKMVPIEHSWVVQMENGKYTRGLDICGDYVYVSTSNRMAREDRKRNTTVCINAFTGKVINEWQMDYDCGFQYGIAVISDYNEMI